MRPYAPVVALRWLNWIFLGGYLPSLSINYVAMSKDMEKRLPQLYYIKMKISHDLGFIAIGVAMGATWESPWERNRSRPPCFQFS